MGEAASATKLQIEDLELNKLEDAKCKGVDQEL